VNPEPCNGHFQLSVPFYDGDNASKVAVRITRIDKALKGMRPDKVSLSSMHRGINLLIVHTKHQMVHILPNADSDIAYYSVLLSFTVVFFLFTLN